jgi:hypothetical protein
MSKITNRKIVKAITLDEIRQWPVTVDIPKACPPLNISKSHGYALAAAGLFPCRVIKIGRRYRVVTADLIALLEGKQTTPAAS